ncbi:MAG: DUF1499 domain-containing protein [Elusimicrobia bacterium]|nr:DUF1499 domain-containing protein [Candidatus Liberimonas magnetica]
MKIFLYSFIGVFLLYIVFFAYLSFLSLKNKQPGLVSKRLKPCPHTPNCVCSEYENNPGFIKAFYFEGPAEKEWDRIKRNIIGSGGRILVEEDAYIWSIFKTRVFRFTDDVEFRLDAKGKAIHVRSASRIGKGDLGANRKRIEKLRLLFNKKG